jgi:hypothetical protein
MNLNWMVGNKENIKIVADILNSYITRLKDVRYF